jgi:hypothetical protein
VNVFEYVLFGLLSGLVLAMIYEFLFEGCKETFHNGVIITVSLSAHRAINSVIPKQLLVVITGVQT